MKAGIFVVLGVALVASCLSVRADDTADQAAARAALELKLRELDQLATQPPTDTNSVAVTAPPAESTTTGAVPQTVPAETIPVAAPATEVPATVAPAKAAPASTAPADADFAQKIPTADASAQAAALAALQQKMNELNQPQAQPVTETPTAEAPVATSPVTASSMVAPLSAAPAVVAPAPKVSTTPVAAASVAVVPVVTAEPVAVPAMTPPAAAPAMPKQTSVLRAPILPSGTPGQRPANQLVTTSGLIYKNVQVERVKEDGIIISYTPANGTWATTKVSFQDLPAEIRQQYGK